ncbi:MAG: AprI/Inh family metalloprotease inhibitor [Brevundimonas sp.]|uniref:AprI/Inh family metalloprotease inhibitor n=1 Tax=Brevundimonas sp. TaxID=1871086 RepID=UPI003919A10E
MSRSIAVLAAAAVLAVGSPVFAQSVERSTTRSETTTTRDGDTTRSVTRSTTVGGEVSVDGERLGEALAGALIDRLDPDEARLRRLAEPARTEDAFGPWRVTDGGRDVGDCRFEMAERAGFLGVRNAVAADCPRRLAQLAKWRVQDGQLVFYSGAGEELKRLRYVEGRFIGAGVEMVRVE